MGGRALYELAPVLMDPAPYRAGQPVDCRTWGPDADVQFKTSRFDQPLWVAQGRLSTIGFICADNALRCSGALSKLSLGQSGTSPGFTQQGAA